MTQEVVDTHTKHIRLSLAAGDLTPLHCLNYLKTCASDFRTRRDWQWIGQQLVMSGHLTVNDENNFIVKNSEVTS